MYLVHDQSNLNWFFNNSYILQYYKILSKSLRVYYTHFLNSIENLYNINLILKLLEKYINNLFILNINIFRVCIKSCTAIIIPIINNNIIISNTNKCKNNSVTLSRQNYWTDFDKILYRYRSYLRKGHNRLPFVVKKRLEEVEIGDGSSLFFVDIRVTLVTRNTINRNHGNVKK